MTKVGFFYYTKRLGGSLLDEYYGKEENIFVKTCTIVLVSQTASGDNADYLVRVEWLGHDAGFGDANALFVLVINCLGDTNLRVELRMVSELSRDQFSGKACSRCSC